VRDASAVDGDDGLDLGRGVIVPLEEVELRTSRSSGPGGQHANVTASRVEAVFDVRASRVLSEADRARLIERLGPRVSAVAQDARSQSRNRDLALARLRDKLAEGLRVRRPRRPTAPTAASRERRLASKRAAGERKTARRRPRQPDEE
jgi:ribosome-associated protein